ncbi:MAG TPA: hypothetical protein VH933_03055 [Aestuariivirgaceae bacterium]|jgi:protein tyrosine phosphatase (PTP) superfamily phosphohydrolase (DUF442 family)
MIRRRTDLLSLVCQAISTFGLSLLMAGSSLSQPEEPEAPFGDKVSERIPFYHRAAPAIGTSGPLGRLGIIEAKAVGFKSILNLGPSTSTVGLDDPSMAAFVLLDYFSVSVSGTLPTQDQIAQMRSILDTPENRPILIYGVDRDQAAAAWTLIRVDSGVPPAIALQEGLTAGLHNRLPAVRERFGLGTSNSGE